MARPVPAPNTPVKDLVIDPAQAKALPPAAANLTFADLQALENAFKDQDQRLGKAAGDFPCCCSCSSAVSTIPIVPAVR